MTYVDYLNAEGFLTDRGDGILRFKTEVELELESDFHVEELLASLEEAENP